MASSDPSKPCTVKKGTKRSAPEVVEAPEPKKSKLSWPFSALCSPGKEKPPADPEPQPAPLSLIEQAIIRAEKNPDWQSLSQTDRIDAIHDARRELESEEKLRCPSRTDKLDLQLDITPDGPKWKKWHKRFQAELMKGTVREVLDRHFEEGQKLSFLPPPIQGIILDIQNEQTKEYKELLKGQLKGARNNIITKLTMLHFGLPVEAASLSNVINAGIDEDDPEDADADLPRVQRIMFAEKSLEFLDLYHERSYGFPILRRPKSTVHHAPQVAFDPIDPIDTITVGDEHLFGHPPPTSIFPESATVSMRGGAGDPVIVYGLNGVGLQVQEEREDSEEDFLAAALRIIRLPKMTEIYEFVVDQYRDQEISKDQPEKEWVKSFPVNQEDFPHIYEQYLKSRLYNRQRDWPLVVRHTSDERSPTFTIPRRLKNPAPPPAPTIKQNLSPTKSGPILPPPKLSPSKKKQPAPPKSPPKSPPKKKTPPGQPTDDLGYPDLSDRLPSQDLPPSLPPTAGATPGPNERVVYSLDGKRSAAFKDCHKSFYQAALKVMNQKCGQDKIDFTVSQYNNAPVRECPPGKFAYIGSEKWPEDSEKLLRAYQNSVESVMFKKADSHGNPAPLDYHKDWRVVVHPTQPRVVKYWPQDSLLNAMVDVTGYKPLSKPSGGKRSPSKQQPGAGADWSKGKKPTPLALKPLAGPKQSSSTTPEKRTGYIHGFGGKLLAENTAADFRRAGSQLLGEDPNSIFHFCFRMGQKFGKYNDIEVDHQNFDQKFEGEILPHIPEIGDWKIFVSKYQLRGEVPLEPAKDKRDVVRIVHGKETTYWKIPKDTETDYGINQLQDDFFRAMRVLFPADRLRPPQNVQIDPFPFVDIGFGGMEVTQELWNKVRGDLKDQTGGLVYTIDLPNVGAQRKLPNASQLIGIRLAGSHEYASAQPTDYVTMQKEIERMGKFLQDGQNPKQFRIWKTAEDRENNGKSVLINYKPASSAAKEIKKFLEGEPGPTNCIWFRPEFPTISIKDITKGNKAKTVDWTVEENGAQLDAFVSTLQDLFNESDPKAIKDIEINDVDSQHRFILSEDTTPCQWRKHIYGWFTGKVIMVQQKKNIVYEVEKMPPWGVPQPKKSPAPLNTQTHTQQNQAQHKTPTTAGLISPTNMPTYQPPQRINKERLLKQRVALPKPVQWNEWQTENNRLDRLQRDSYHTDQSIIEPGQQPAAPIYGPSRQDPLSVGSSLPEPYLWGTTPSDFARKAAECQALRNSALERMSRCQLCDTTFPEYETEKITAHLKGHQDSLREVGKCPLCDCCWSALDKEQKKQHLWTHQTQGEQDLIKNFWQGFQCPICDEDLQSLSNEDVLAHMADHPPGLLKFCDRCGLDISSCDEAQRARHKQTCRETEKAENVVFCGRCGNNRSHENDQDRQIHDRICINGDTKFCTVCALNLSGLCEVVKKRHWDNHKPPGGPRKTFCKRCGKNLVTMNAHDRDNHMSDCYWTEPHVIDPRERIQELERRISQAKILKAHNNAEDARLSLKRRELEARENAIKNHEAGLGIQAPVSTGFASSPGTFKCPLLKPNGSVCNLQITITPCGGELKAHYQHNCQPCGDKYGGSTLQELLRLYPELKAGSDKLQAAADKAKAQNARARPSQHRGHHGGDSNEETSGTVEPDEVIPPRPAAGKGKSPTKHPQPKPSNTASKAKKVTLPSAPAAEDSDELDNLPEPSTENDPSVQPESESETPETPGHGPRKGKGKTTAPARKVSGKTPAGSKRKKAVIEDEDEAGGHHGKTPKGSKRQRTTREVSVAHTASSVLGSDSAEEDVLKEVSAPVVVRRTTRATSGTPGPSMPSMVVRKVGMPKAKAGEDQLEEADGEEEAAIMRSPGKRGRPHSPKKGGK